MIETFLFFSHKLTKLTNGKTSERFISMLARTQRRIPGALNAWRKALMYSLVVCFVFGSGIGILSDLVLSLLDHKLSLLMNPTMLSRLDTELPLRLPFPALSRLPLVLPLPRFSLLPALSFLDKLLSLLDTSSFEASPSFFSSSSSRPLTSSLGSCVVGANFTLSFLVTVSLWQFWFTFSLLNADSLMVSNCSLNTGSQTLPFVGTCAYPPADDLNTSSALSISSSS